MDKNKTELIELLTTKLEFQTAYSCVEAVETKYGGEPIAIWVSKIKNNPSHAETFISKCLKAGWLTDNLTLNTEALPRKRPVTNNPKQHNTNKPVEPSFFDEVSFYSGAGKSLTALTLSYCEKNKSGKSCLFLSFATPTIASKNVNAPEFDWNNAVRYQLYPTEALALLGVVLGYKEQLKSPSLKPDAEPGIYHQYDGVSKRLKARYQSGSNTVYIECIQGNNTLGVNLYPEGRCRFTAYTIGKIKMMHPYNNLDDATLFQMISKIF